MNTLKGWPVVALMASLVLALGLAGGASAAGVVNQVTVGGPDLCDALGLPIGCDANFSLVALQKADGSVKGQYHDQFTQFPGFGGSSSGIHVAVNCLNIIGTQAWVSGVITQSRIPGLVGLDALTSVVDNGRSANDPPDEISFSFIGADLDCNAPPVVDLFPVPQGQVVVK